MRTVVATSPGVLELNWQWLPTWIGMNTALKVEIETALSSHVIGKLMNDETLDWAHSRVIDLLTAKFPGVTGLRAFLEGLVAIEAV